MVYTIPLSELEHDSLPLAGGKGAHLGILIHGGFPVPPGFCITTDAYQAFVDANHFQKEILQICKELQVDDLDALEAASTAIRTRFAAGQVPAEIVNDIREAYANLKHQIPIVNQQSAIVNIPVAVRSSATAEDLPDMSFAGQQDTYLNIVGEEALLQAVVDCWGSLWTARAIGYRARNDISQDDVALAVIVQEMVPSEASGVLFTANPLTGRRSETVIDATFGLGEALVSGQVEPDHYVVDDGKIIDKTLGAKAVAIHGQSGGGTRTVTEDASTRQALPDDIIVELAQMGKRIERHWKRITGLPYLNSFRRTPRGPCPLAYSPVVEPSWRGTAATSHCNHSFARRAWERGTTQSVGTRRFCATVVLCEAVGLNLLSPTGYALRSDAFKKGDRHRVAVRQLTSMRQVDSEPVPLFELPYE